MSFIVQHVGKTLDLTAMKNASSDAEDWSRDSGCGFFVGGAATIVGWLDATGSGDIGNMNFEIETSWDGTTWATLVDFGLEDTLPLFAFNAANADGGSKTSKPLKFLRMTCTNTHVAWEGTLNWGIY